MAMPSGEQSSMTTTASPDAAQAGPDLHVAVAGRLVEAVGEELAGEGPDDGAGLRLEVHGDGVGVGVVEDELTLEMLGVRLAREEGHDGADGGGGAGYETCLSMIVPQSRGRRDVIPW